MKKILFPQDWGNFPTLYDMWHNVTEGEISPLGSGSDYASFYQNGIGCVSSFLGFCFACILFKLCLSPMTTLILV